MKVYNLSWGTLNEILSPEISVLPSSPLFVWKQLSGPSILNFENLDSVTGEIEITNIVSSGTYSISLTINGASPFEQVVEEHNVIVSDVLPSSNERTEIIDWNKVINITANLGLDETIRYKNNSLITDDESVVFSKECFKQNGTNYYDTDKIATITDVQVGSSLVELTVTTIPAKVNIDNLVSSINSLKSITLRLGYGTLYDDVDNENVDLFDVVATKINATTLKIEYDPSLDQCDNFENTGSDFWINNMESDINIYRVQTFYKDIPIPPSVLQNSSGNTFLTFKPNSGVSTKYQFEVEKLNDVGDAIGSFIQIVLVTAPTIDASSEAISLVGNYSINSDTINVSSFAKYAGTQVVYYFKGIEIGRSVIALNGSSSLVLANPFGKTGELKVRIVTGSGSSNYSSPKLVSGPRIDLDILDPTVECDNISEIGEEYISLYYNIKNNGPDIIPTGTKIYVKLFTGINESDRYDNALIEWQNTNVGTFSKPTSDELLLTTTRSVVVGETFSIHLKMTSVGCSDEIECLRIRMILPSALSSQCDHESHCFFKGKPISERPTLFPIKCNDEILRGAGCPLGFVKKLYVKSQDSTEYVEFDINSEIDLSGNIEFEIPEGLEFEIGDSVTIAQECIGKGLSIMSNEVIVEAPDSLTKKCLSGINIRGMEAQQYEAQIFNYTQQKPLGRMFLTGSQFGISIPFNMPNIKDEDLVFGDMIGLKIISSCCPTLESNLIKYNPIKSLRVNYTCEEEDNVGKASINPSWVGGEYPITMSIRDRLTGDVILVRNIEAADQSKLINNIPNGELRLEVGDCGGCTEYLDFSSNCIIYSATKTSVKSGIFYRQNCPTGCTPKVFTYVIQRTATAHSPISQEIANQLAQTEADNLASADIALNGQNQANIYGICENCSSPTPPPAPVYVPTPVWVPTSNCVDPSWVNVQGETSPLNGQTYRYVAVRAGGENNQFYWSAVGGNVVGQGSDWVDINWSGSDGEGMVQVTVRCSGTSGFTANLNVWKWSQPVPVYVPPTPVPVPVYVPTPEPTPTPIPIPTAPECTMPTSINMNGNFSPIVNSTENYSLSIDGGNNYSLVWTVSGGTILSGQGTANITVQWDGNSGTEPEDLHSVAISAGCAGGGSAEFDFEFFHLAEEPPIPVPVVENAWYMGNSSPYSSSSEACDNATFARRWDKELIRGGEPSFVVGDTFPGESGATGWYVFSFHGVGPRVAVRLENGVVAQNAGTCP